MNRVSELARFWGSEQTFPGTAISPLHSLQVGKESICGISMRHVRKPKLRKLERGASGGP